MSLLRNLSILFIVIGLIALIVPGIPGAELLRWGIVLAVICFVADLLTGNRG